MGLFEEFTAQLEAYTKTQQTPALGDRDVQFSLELHQNRLRQKDMRLEYKIVPRGQMPAQTAMRNVWQDDRYRNEMEWQSCALTRTFLKANAPIHQKEEYKTFYQTITYVKDGSDVSNDPYVCPNCGAFSTIKELQNGCRYCGTHFIMQDLFPKVTNFFFLDDQWRTGGEVKREILKYAKPWAAIAAVGFLAVHLVNKDLPLMMLLSQLVVYAVATGAVMGYLTWVWVKMAGLFRGAAKAIGFLSAASGSSKKFESSMRQYSPEFSYEYFSNKVVSLLKMLVFAADAQELPNYSGPSVGNMFADIVEMSFYGIVLNRFAEKDGTVFVTVTVHMDDFYERNGRIAKKDDRFQMKLHRKVNRPFDYRFSVKSVQCKTCAASFDATKSKTCPYCGTQYEIENDDWVVTEIKKVP